MYGLPDSFTATAIRRASRGSRGLGGGGGSSSMFRLNTVRVTRNIKTTYTYKFQGLTFREQALYKELQTNSGGLWRYLEIKGERAVQGAKRQVGVRTGRLRRSIHKRHLGYTVGGGGQYLMVGSWTVPYAEMHHRGTKPHWITPSQNDNFGGNMLQFSGKGGARIYATAVYHPGTKPNRYLSSQLHHFRGIKSVAPRNFARPIPKGLV